MNLSRTIVFSVVALALMTALSLWALTVLPGDALVAVHFNMHGEADRFAPTMLAVAILPAAAALATAVFALAPRIERTPVNLERSAKAYVWLWIAVVGLLLVAHVALIAVALGVSLNIPRGLTATLGVFLLVTGNVAGKIQPSSSLGVRTPWTLASDRSWAKTHRLFGWLSVLVGLGLIALAALDAPAVVLSVAMLVAVSSIVILSTAYSYWIWRQDARGKQPL